MLATSSIRFGLATAFVVLGCSSPVRNDVGAPGGAPNGGGGGSTSAGSASLGGNTVAGTPSTGGTATLGGSGGVPASAGTAGTTVVGGSGGAGSGGDGGASSGGGSGNGGAPPTPSCMGSVMKKTPLVMSPYTADPSAHVFDGKLYFYPSHDIDTGVAEDNDGAQYDMKDYHVYSFDDATCKVTDHGVALALADVPWAQKQLWAPDAAYKNGKYHLVFPARDQSGIFRIGIATAASPIGPFTAEAQPLAGSFSIDPALFIDDDGSAYLYFGGLMGGQLEKWRTGQYVANGSGPADTEAALGPRVVKLAADLKSFDGSVSEVRINDSGGAALKAGDHDRRFFEAAWLHKRSGTYYLSYSTGDTHFIAYATGTSPTGPFTYRGRVLSPPSGWTTHHSIVQFKGDWLLFYHENALSGKNHLRSVQLADLSFAADGTIPTITP
jgi:hypothetical protein